jgi:hypothetical protein
VADGGHSSVNSAVIDDVYRIVESYQNEKFFVAADGGPFYVAKCV